MNGILNKVTQNKKICFVKSVTTPPKRVTNKSGILFLANNWKVVTDCNKQHVFSIQIAITAICQTFNILSITQSYRYHWIDLSTWRKCGQMAFNKVQQIWATGAYHKKSCWAVDLFAVEVAAWGYPSRNVLSCLQKLGFPKLARSTPQILGHTHQWHVLSTFG